MFTTSAARRAFVAVSGTALTLSMLAACAESSADDPATGTEEAPTTVVENSDNYDGDPWEQRLLEQRKKEAGTYVGDPWEKRLQGETP